MNVIPTETSLDQPGVQLVSAVGKRLGVCHQATIVFSAACFAIFVLSVHVIAQTNVRRPRSSLELRSSDTRLVQSFSWAKQQALAYVNDGDPVGPWYEAALPGRQAFCMRDVSHQAAGAQALGLARYTHNMLRRFAENISSSRDWCSYWEIDRLNRPAPIDYVNDRVFWYNLPANFDVLDTCYRMYLWSGDRSYIEDPVFLNFYHHTVTDYVLRWNLDLAHVMTRETAPQDPSHFRGDPSYGESRRDIALGVDLLATQYAGYRSYAAIMAIRGDDGAAQMYLRSASDVKGLINRVWWNPAEGHFFEFLDKDHQFQGRAGADLLYRDVVDDGLKAQGALDTLLKTMQDEPASAIEPESHYAEILYRYGDPDAAYAEIMDLTRPGRERQGYPEVSYSVIGAIVNGLMGIIVEPDVRIEDLVQGKPFETVVSTLPQLTTNTTWAEVRNLPVQDGLISVRHDGDSSTVLTNQGKKDLTWEAVFPGAFPALIVNGKPIKAYARSGYFDRELTWVKVTVKAGRSSRVEIPK